MRSRLVYLLLFLLAFSVPLKAQTQTQIEPMSSLKVQPIPLPGGDIFPPYGLYNQFFPGFSGQPGFDPMNADPQGITNFHGVTAMGYTSGFTADKNFAVVTDIRVYQGDYIGGEIADPTTAGATQSARAHGTFVEIWIDLWTYSIDPSSGSLTLKQQVHDFSPWTLPNGLFWILKVPDSAVQISPDGNTLTIHLEKVPVVDAFMFPPPVPDNIASDEVNISPYQLIRARTSFDITYTKTPGTARRVRPSTDDPLSPLNWAGKMWNATNSGSFSVAYDDGTFSASGTFGSGSGSSGNFGEMGTERNGFFVHHEDQDDNDDVEAGEQPLSLLLQPANMSQSAATANPDKPVTFALLKGRVPVKVSH